MCRVTSSFFSVCIARHAPDRVKEHELLHLSDRYTIPCPFLSRQKQVSVHQIPPTLKYCAVARTLVTNSCNELIGIRELFFVIVRYIYILNVLVSWTVKYENQSSSKMHFCCFHGNFTSIL